MTEIIARKLAAGQHGLLPVSGEKTADPDDSRVEVVRVRQGDDAEVVGAGPVEPGALDDLDLLAQQQVKDELLVVMDLVHGRVQAGEGVQRTLGLDAGDAGDLVQPLPGPVPLLAQPAAREVLDSPLKVRQSRSGARTAAQWWTASS